MKHSLVALAVLMVTAPLAVADTNSSATSGELEVGLGYLDSSAYRYGQYTGLIDEGVYGLLDFSLAARAAPGFGDTGYWHLWGQDLGLGYRALGLEAGQQGTQRLRLDYRKTPRYFTDTAQTPMLGAGSNRLNLPAGWQSNDATTAGMSSLDEHLSQVNLWQERHTLTLDYRRFLNDNWTLTADFRRDNLQGVRALGGVSGATGGNSRALLLPAPIDYTTHAAELALAYHSARYYWGFGYYGSFFSNEHQALSWPTPFAAHPQWAVGTGYPEGENRMALEPDNQAHQLRLHAGYHFAGTTRLHMDANLGRQRQNADFLPYTINSALEVSEPLPRDSLQARVDDNRVNLRLTSRPARAFNLVARINYRDRDNRTPVDVYQRVRGDAVAQQSYLDGRINRPYSLRETKASTDLGWRFSRYLRLEAGYVYNDTRRDYSEVTQTREHSIKLGARSTRFDSLALSGHYQYQQRRADEYVGNRPLMTTHVPGSVGAEDFENHPLLRKYYLTDRDRHQWHLRGDWFAWQNVNLGAAIAWHRDHYPDTVFGLTDSRMTSYTLDAGYTPVENLRLTAFVNRDSYHNEQAGRSFRGSVPADAFDPERNWYVDAKDRFDTLGVSLDWEQLQQQFDALQNLGRLDVRLELSHSRATGTIVTETASALTSASLPELSTRLERVSLEARYHLSVRSSLRLALEHERFSSHDYALDGVAPDAVASVLLLGQTSPRYSAIWSTLAWRYRF
ncbi:MAG TPA: MtrB/PioB family decaheme-associated outer membrane protein [Cellvibrionaceae bacterium]